MLGVDEKTGRVHAGCATFEYLPKNAYDNLPYIKTRSQNVYILDGEADIYDEVKDNSSMTFVIENCKEGTIIELPYIYYLGYLAKLIDNNGNVTKLEIIESSNGFISLILPEATEGTIEFKYTGTTLMKISYTISIISLIAFIVLIIYYKRKQKDIID